MYTVRKTLKIIPRSSLRRCYSIQSTSESKNEKRKKFTILDIQKKYKNNIPITMMTCYDYTSAKLIDESEIDTILVGDSLGMVMLGYESTVQVTMDDMIHHCKAVSRGAKSSFLIGDMPFGSYDSNNPSLAIHNATRFLKEGGMDCVKMECGSEMFNTVKHVVECGIPVIGHIGLTPQRSSALGGFRVQGKTIESAKKCLEDALALQEAGCFCILIESVPELLAKYITEKLKVPTIGIGAGRYTSGQVLVYHDMLGMYSDFTPKFVKRFANLKEPIMEAMKKYKKEVEERTFPSKEHTYLSNISVLQKAFPDFYEFPSLPKKEDSSSNPTKKNIVVIGGGAMGSFLASKLSNYNVSILSSWNDHINKINSNGLIVENEEQKIIKNIKAYNDIHQLKKDIGELDLIIIAVKSPSTREAAEKAKMILGEKGVVLTLQNGIGNKEILEEILGKDRVIAGVTYHGVKIVKEGQIQHTGEGMTLIAKNGKDLSDIISLFNECGIQTKEYNNIDELLWGKLLINAAINPTTALFKIKNGEILTTPEAQELIKNIEQEALQIISKKGIKLPYKDVIEEVYKVAKATSDNTSSMLSDKLRGVQTEIDAMNGVLVKEGKKLGIPVPVNSTIVNLIKMLK